MEQDATYELVIQRVFEAPRARVWAAWTTEEMREWECPEGFTCSQAVSDVRVGGKYRCAMVGPDKKKHVVEGVYREVRKNDRLVFTHVWEGDAYPNNLEPVVKVDLKPFGGGKTKLNFSQTNLSSLESLEGYRQGWQESFDKLENLLRKEAG